MLFHLSLPAARRKWWNIQWTEKTDVHVSIFMAMLWFAQWHTKAYTVHYRVMKEFGLNKYIVLK